MVGPTMTLPHLWGLLGAFRVPQQRFDWTQGAFLALCVIPWRHHENSWGLLELPMGVSQVLAGLKEILVAIDTCEELPGPVLGYPIVPLDHFGAAPIAPLGV